MTSKITLHRGDGAIKTQNGNVLFLILVAVALFAALSYAVTKTTSSSGTNADDEKSSLITSEILQWITTIQTTILRLQISNGCTQEQISFENSTVTGYIFTTPNNCKLFHPEGGNLTWKSFDDYRVPYADVSSLYQLRYSAPYFGVQTAFTGVGTADRDLIFLIHHLQSAEACKQINQEFLNVSTIPSIPNSRLFWLIRFKGTYPNFPVGTVNHADINDHTIGCITDASAPGHQVFAVLFAR